MHSKTTHRHSFPNDGAKVLLFVGTDWEKIPKFVRKLSELSESDLSVSIYVSLWRVFVHKPPKFIGETRTKVTQGMGDAEGLKHLVKALAFFVKK